MHVQERAKSSTRYSMVPGTVWWLFIAAERNREEHQEAKPINILRLNKINELYTFQEK